jgi:Ca-activated chloride channel family protein
MLNLILKSHRDSLKAGTAEVQKIYAMLKLIPKPEVARARPPLAFALVIDTSGSMREFADMKKAAEEVQKRGLQGQQQTTGDGSYQGFDLTLPTKLDQAIQAGHAFLDDNRLASTDQVSVIHFDDDARTLLPLTPLTNKVVAHQALEGLRQCSGGTQMGKGLRCAHQALSDLAPEVAKRVLLLTDGKTFDEPDCRPLAEQLAENNSPIISISFGTDDDDKLLTDLAHISQGRPYHFEDKPLREIFDHEVGSSVREVVTDLQATVALVKSVSLEKLTRVYPSLSEVSLSTQPYRLGNIEAGEYTVFILELTVAGIARPPSRVRLARVGLTGHALGLGRRDEFDPQDLYLAFTTDEAAVAAVDAEVLGYVQQTNVDRMVQEAVRQATVDAGRARKTLQLAVGMTQRLGNSAMTRMLENALEELNQTGTISPGTRKTVALGGKTKTIKTSGTKGLEGVPSEEEIRKLTGA